MHEHLLCQEVFFAASSFKRLREYRVHSAASAQRRLLGAVSSPRRLCRNLLTKEAAHKGDCDGQVMREHKNIENAYGFFGLVVRTTHALVSTRPTVLGRLAPYCTRREIRPRRPAQLTPWACPLGPWSSGASSSAAVKGASGQAPSSSSSSHPTCPVAWGATSP